MASPSNSTIRPPLTRGATEGSLHTSALSTRRRAPTPSISFKSLNALNPYQAPGSNVNSPGSLYLSPPISTPSFMSPPPRLEAEDYLNSHGGKKKHSARLGALPKSSPLALQSSSFHQSAPPEPDEITRSSNAASKDEVDSVLRASIGNTTLHNVQIKSQQQRRLLSPFFSALETQNPFEEIERESSLISQETSRSPAVTSLRRLSKVVGGTAADVPSEEDEVVHPSLSVLKSLSKKSDMDSQTSKNLVDEPATVAPWYGLRRRSTGLRDPDERQQKKKDTSAAVLGLEIPATITLRKATGLFQIGSDPAPSAPPGSDQLKRAREGSVSSPATCTLVDFDSRSFDTRDTDHRNRISTGTNRNSGLLVSNLSSTRLTSPDSRRQSLAETSVTISNTFPSPAILAFPASASSPTSEGQRRFSVVHIKSRRSLHQIIWREDETSSSSEPSSRSSSLTRPASIKLPDTSENSPAKISPVSSKVDTQLTPSPTLSEPGALKANGPVTAEKLATFNAAVTQPQGQMLQWSWDVAEDTPIDPIDSSEAAKSVPCAVERPDEPRNDTPFGTMPAIPRLSIPGEEDPFTPGPAMGITRRCSFAVDPPSLGIARRGSFAVDPPSLGIDRRGSFAVDSTSLGGVMREREAGNRRSISITPLMLARLGGGDLNDGHDAGQGMRRLSRVE